MSIKQIFKENRKDWQLHAVWCLVNSWDLVVTVELKDGNQLVKPAAKAGCRGNFTFIHIQLLPCILCEGLVWSQTLHPLDFSKICYILSLWVFNLFYIIHPPEIKRYHVLPGPQ